MKKALCVVILLAVTIPAFAAGVVWESDLPSDFPSLLVPQGVAGRPDPQAQPQNAQQSPQNMLPSVNPQPSPSPSQPADAGIDKQKEEELEIYREANEIQRRLVFLGWAIGIGQVILIGIQIYYTRAATRYAGDAAVAAKESASIADRSLRTVERPILSIGEWEFDCFKPGAFGMVRLIIWNAGRTPAHLRVKRMLCVLTTETSIKPSYSKFRQKAMNVTVPPQGRLRDIVHISPLHADNALDNTIRAEEYEGVNKGTWHIYCCGSLSYADDFGDLHEVGFLVQYDFARKEFVVMGSEPQYNYST